MRLIYSSMPEIEVKEGDRVTLSSGEEDSVAFFAKPHKPSSEGRVFLASGRELYVSCIGAKWVEREDRQYLNPHPF